MKLNFVNHYGQEYDGDGLRWADDVSDFEFRVVLLVAVLLLATLAGELRRRQAGRSRAVIDGDLLTADELGLPLGRRATFVQFSSPACSPCRAVRRVLGDLTGSQAGLAHIELDAVEHLDLTRRLGILRTPTVLLLDPDGRVVRRISGPLTAEQARAAVPEALTSPDGPDTPDVSPPIRSR